MKYLMGSSYFFSCYEDFVPHDIDEIEIVETDKFQHKRQITGKGRCYFQLRKKDSYEDYLEWDISTNLGMNVGKWLVPEFCAAVGFPVEELFRLQPMIDILDDKHKYEEIIYNAYVTNNSFTLTDEQRLAAYNSYRAARGLSTVE